jgi:hypothetical protein
VRGCSRLSVVMRLFRCAVGVAGPVFSHRKLKKQKRIKNFCERFGGNGRTQGQHDGTVLL